MGADQLRHHCLGQPLSVAAHLEVLPTRAADRDAVAHARPGLVEKDAVRPALVRPNAELRVVAAEQASAHWPTPWRKPPAATYSSRRNDMMAPIRLRTGWVVRGMPR